MKTLSLDQAYDAESQARVEQISHMKDSKFVLHYFPVHTYVTSIRFQLIFAGVEWEDKLQDFDTFSSIKSEQPFGTLPVLYETTTDGDGYLARKFDQLGANECQKLQHMMIVSIHKTMSKHWLYSYVMNGNEQEKAKVKKKMYDEYFPAYLAKMEKVAMRNGFNGHFVGEKFSLIDAKFVGLFDKFIAMDTDDFITKQAYPALFKVKQTLDTYPPIAEYRKSETYAKITANVNASFANRKNLPFDLCKADLY
ncbi:Glutathione S-transferase S1 [Actinomortierella ambigua]|nr:Glutathione S-transferase S1 [Actinomortierella ambigua]